MRTWHSPIFGAISTVVLGLLNAHGAPSAAPQNAFAPLELETTIPPTGVSGRIDHLAIDVKRRRLFVAELGNNSVDVIDLDKGRAIDRIAGLHEPQGVGVSEGVLAVANGGDGTVSLYRSNKLSPLGSIPLGKDADDVRVDQATGRMFVGFGQGAIAVIDPAAVLKSVRSSSLPILKDFNSRREVTVGMSTSPARARSRLSQAVAKSHRGAYLKAKPTFRWRLRTMAAQQPSSFVPLLN